MNIVHINPLSVYAAVTLSVDEGTHSLTLVGNLVIYYVVGYACIGFAVINMCILICVYAAVTLSVAQDEDTHSSSKSGDGLS